MVDGNAEDNDENTNFCDPSVSFSAPLSIFSLNVSILRAAVKASSEMIGRSATKKY